MNGVDTRGDSSFQAAWMRTRWIGNIPNCNGNPFWVPSPPGPYVRPPPNPNPFGRSGRGVWLMDQVNKLAKVGKELLGVKEAAAQVCSYGTPNLAAPRSGATITLNPPYVHATVSALVPTGFTNPDTCILANPDWISHLDLFDGIRTRSGARAQWKGCVEARPDPFDVTDDPPNLADPHTLFTAISGPMSQASATRATHSVTSTTTRMTAPCPMAGKALGMGMAGQPVQV
ncbi:MAG: hypothetical protein NTZ14_10980 [Hyphomicrobiales bacterium]|nr:hypothetical protein [Hyphomicrobiales bacterium]